MSSTARQGPGVPSPRCFVRIIETEKVIEMSGENTDRLLGEKMERFAMVSDAKCGSRDRF